ncbi:MAG: hypothetical protein Roseis2KO_44490 [Roseivirga sp.]
MANTYKKLLSIRLTHTYYESRYTSDFSIIPLPETQKLVNQYKLVLRPAGNGFDVMSLVNADDTPFIDLGDSNKLSFALMLRNTAMLNITSLPAKQHSAQLYYITNKPSPGISISIKDWTLVDPRATSFSYSRQTGANEVTLKTTGPFGDSTTEQMIKQGDQFVSDFELGNRPEGRYQLEATEDGIKKPVDSFYVSEMLWKARPFALIDIFTQELDYSSPKNYYIRLGAKKAHWVYHVNLSKDYTGSTISIEDGREAPEVLFKVQGNVNLAKGKTLMFKAYKADDPHARAKIRFSEKPLTDFKLVIEKNGTKTEIAGLPNPAIDQVKTEMHINI